MRDQLEKLVQEMLDKGILYDDARREFEKMFISRALQRSKGNVGDAAEMLGPPPQHRRPQDDRIPHQALNSDLSALLTLAVTALDCLTVLCAPSDRFSSRAYRVLPPGAQPAFS